MDTERAIERLYGLPLEDFTAARNELARTLSEEGLTENAARVRKLKKPPVSAWAVNRLARDDPASMQRLLELVDELREARSAPEIHELSAQRRELVATMARRAAEIMERAGHAASGTALQRVTQTLQAGGEDDEHPLMLRGILSHDLAPAGFGAFGDLGDATHFTPPPPDTGAEVEELRRIAAEAEEQAARLGAEAERAEAAAVRAS
ncbi:MAG: hypothetical protein M3271_03790, partial [Actinomycetota bacterium]|nr:hypothetical protein [Actinomycetota bacterium]